MLARHPLIGITTCFIAGTWFGLTQSIPVLNVFIVSWAFVLLALVSLRLSTRHDLRQTPLSNAIRSLPLFFAVFFTSWAAAGVRAEQFGTCSLPSLCAEGLARVEICGVVADDPSVGETSGTNRVLWQFALNPETVRQSSNDPPRIARSPVLVRLRTWTDRKPPAYGDKWRLTGRIRPDTSGRRNFPGRFFLTADSGASARLSGGNGSPFVKWCYEQRRTVAGYLSAGIDDFPEQVGLLRALILGYRQDLPPDVKTNFAWTGTLHIIAISGSHIVVVAGILIFVLQALGVSRVHWGLFLGPLLIIYTVAIGMPASAVRATLMAIIYFSAPLLRRKADVLSSLAMAALIILAVAPGQLFDLGFILSFVCVLGLIILCPLINAPLMKLLEPDPLRLQPEEVWVMALRDIGRYFVSLLALAVAGWLVSTPLSAYYFGRFSIVALPANLFVIPLAFFILVSGCLSLALGPCAVVFADIFNHANLALVTAMLESMDFMAHIPYGSIQCEWPLWALLAWFLVLAIAAIWLHSRRLSRAEESQRPAP